MPNYRMTLMRRVVVCSLAGASAVSSGETIQSQASENEQTLWNLEHAYWRYAQDKNLALYLGLWHKDFLGWPSVSAAPVRKDHITDWITSQTNKGLALRPVEFKPAAIQISGDAAVTCYWITYKWLEKDGKGAAHTLRITHTWVQDGKDWRIIGGMSMDNLATQSGATSVNSEESQVRKVENELTKALLHGDASALNRLYAADYVHTGPDGVLSGRSDRIAELRSGARKFTYLKRDDVLVRMYGMAAVVTDVDARYVQREGDWWPDTRDASVGEAR
jgi:ketosteroid isomerase-like protein